jgi:hypothetical protein
MKGEAHPTLSLTLCGMGQITSETHSGPELNDAGHEGMDCLSRQTGYV